MRFLGLNLPPLTLILLLAFLWFLLLVLLLWSWLRPRAPLEPQREELQKSRRSEPESSVILPRPQVVREVKPEPRSATEPDDARPDTNPFDSYRPNSRRDDFDF